MNTMQQSLGAMVVGVLLLSGCTVSVGNGGDEAVVPEQAALVQLTNGSMYLFADAVTQKSFSSLYRTISDVWKQQIDEPAFQKTFAVFIEKEVDLSYIKTVTPTFSEPALIDNDGALNIKGLYPASGAAAHFELRYVYEQDAWKLVGLNVKVK